jgi:hypothetical protein
VKLIRADINPPGDFDLSEDLPRFSQGNEPPLNLTEKVNRVVMDRMRAARNKPAEQPDTHKTSGEPKQKKHTREGKVSEKNPERIPEKGLKDALSTRESNAPATNNQAASEGLNDKQAATQLDSLKVRHPSELSEISEDRGPEAADQKQTQKLEWFSTWDDD